MDVHGSIPGRGWDFSPPRPDRLSEPRSLRFNWYQDLSHGVKWPRRETDHLPPSRAKVNEWSYTSTPQYVFVA